MMEREYATPYTSILVAKHNHLIFGWIMGLESSESSCNVFYVLFT
jgi:hypothetical protein